MPCQRHDDEIFEIPSASTNRSSILPAFGVFNFLFRSSCSVASRLVKYDFQPEPASFQTSKSCSEPLTCFAILFFNSSDSLSGDFACLTMCFRASAATSSQYASQYAVIKTIADLLSTSSP